VVKAASNTAAHNGGSKAPETNTAHTAQALEGTVLEGTVLEGWLHVKLARGGGGAQVLY
jgi:hypothetical protein